MSLNLHLRQVEGDKDNPKGGGEKRDWYIEMLASEPGGDAAQSPWEDEQVLGRLG